VLAVTLLLTFEVALAGDTRFVDGVTFLGHAVVGGVLFLFHFTYIEICWHSTQLLDADRFLLQTVLIAFPLESLSRLRERMMSKRMNQ
jgi:hypothetical protein